MNEIISNIFSFLPIFYVSHEVSVPAASQYDLAPHTAIWYTPRIDHHR